ncbi:MAG: hypothetical protein WC314_16455 [Vulcanimicrobiota bacterium]
MVGKIIGTTLLFKLMGATVSLFLLSAAIGFVGKLLCLATQDSQARITLWAALAAELAAAALHWSGQESVKGSGSGTYLTLLSFLLFLSFLSRVATKVERPDLARLASMTVWSGLGIFLFILVMGKTGMMVGLGLGTAILLMLAMALIPFACYVTLLIRLFFALSGSTDATWSED